MIPEEGERDLLAFAVGKTKTENLELRLYANDHVPLANDDRSNYTEVAGGGYASVVLRGALWEFTDKGIECPEWSFKFTGAVGNVFGWYLTRETSGRLAWAGRFVDGPYDVRTRGDIIIVAAFLAFRSVHPDASKSRSVHVQTKGH